MNNPPHRARASIITSASNPRIKVFKRSLAEGRSGDGFVAIEGPHLVEEALKAGARAGQTAATAATDRVQAMVRSVVAAEGAREKLNRLLKALPPGAELAFVPDALFDRMAATAAPQGVAALVEMTEPPLESLLARPHFCCVILCGLQDPGNVGSILRSAQAFGADCVMALATTANPSHPKVTSSSAGAIFHVPVYAEMELHALVARLRSANVQVIAADGSSRVRLDQADLRGPAAFLIGQEGGGLSARLLSLADMRLAIPLAAGMDSLNAATAASIFLYEMARQRDFRGSGPVG